jgi:DNA-binding MarR family transcriptional regulator/N-acetylglutamate synthase-like GNAT family acetyltransferase
VEPATMDARVAAVRRFNRTYTNVLGLLHEGLLDTRYSLTEARVVFELAQRDETPVGDLRASLDIDAGYLSRILGRFEARGIVERERSSADARRQVIRLTDEGRSAFRELDNRAAEQVRVLLARLGEDEQRRSVAAMITLEEILEVPDLPKVVVLRAPRSGDFGWVIERHGAVYAQEFGWDATFEALVARIVADFIEHRDPEREAAWVAEVDGERVGCVFCVKKTDEVAQLRILLVEPNARGIGLGTRLVDECIRFARDAGYTSMILWTNDVLHDARRIYERAGFRLIEEEPHHSFGHDLVGQTWEMTL